MSKGSARRPTDADAFGTNFDNIFRKKTMSDYTELNRLAEDCKERGIDFDDVSPQQGSTSCDKLVRHYIAAASPDVVLSMIAEIDRLKAYNEKLIEEGANNLGLARERDDLLSQVCSLNVGFNNCQNERNALRTQNQALLKELNYIAGISNGQVKRVAEQSLEGLREDDTFGLSMSMFASKQDYEDEKNRRARALLDVLPVAEGGGMTDAKLPRWPLRYEYLSSLGYVVWRDVFEGNMTCALSDAVKGHKVAVFVTESEAEDYCNYRNIKTMVLGTDKV